MTIGTKIVIITKSKLQEILFNTGYSIYKLIKVKYEISFSIYNPMKYTLIIYSKLKIVR